jgi:hypothetical protein
MCCKFWDVSCLETFHIARSSSQPINSCELVSAHDNTQVQNTIHSSSTVTNLHAVLILFSLLQAAAIELAASSPIVRYNSPDFAANRATWLGDLRGRGFISRVRRNIIRIRAVDGETDLLTQLERFVSRLATSTFRHDTQYLYLCTLVLPAFTAFGTGCL